MATAIVAVVGVTTTAVAAAVVAADIDVTIKGE